MYIDKDDLITHFFRVFEIDEQCICPYFPEYMENGCEICIKYFQGEKDCNKKNRYKYPDITTEKLLEMICICNSTYINGYTNYFTATGKTKEELKEEILKKCIVLSKDIKNKIQQLFEGEQ